MNSQMYNQVSINIDSNDSSWFTDYNRSKHNGFFSKCKRKLLRLTKWQFVMLIILIILTLTSAYTLTMNRPKITESKNFLNDKNAIDFEFKNIDELEKSAKKVENEAVKNKHLTLDIKKANAEMNKADSNDLQENKNISPYAGPTNSRQREVVSSFRHAWRGYERYAWGKDILKPVSRTSETWFDLGMTILDSVDGLYIMGMTEEYDKAHNWIANRLNFNVGDNVNLFECTIRILGSLLTMFSLTQDSMYKAKAIDLGDRLLTAFDSKSQGLVPYSDVNLMLRKGVQVASDTSTSEATTVQLEFIELSRITGDDKYEKAVKKVTEHVHKQPKAYGALVGRYLSMYSGKLINQELTLGSRADSYYEYLLKMWLQSGREYELVRKDYIEAIDAINNHLRKKSEPNKLSYVGEIISKSFRPKMDHLVCFLPGTLALGAHFNVSSDPSVNGMHMEFAEQLLKTCIEMYTGMPTHLSPEIAHFNQNPQVPIDIIVKDNDRHNLLRPETVESLFYLYRITGNQTYRDIGYKIYQAFEKYTKLEHGYSSIRNVKSIANPNPMDKMETFFLGETLKYFYLLFSDDPNLLPFDQWVFNTEAHPLPLPKNLRRSDANSPSL